MKTSAVRDMVGIGILCIMASTTISEELPTAPTSGAPEKVLAPGKQMFQPIAVDPALVRQSMQARSEYEDLNRKIIARQSKLYEENPAIKDLQMKMRDIQKKIDAILADDEELKKLKDQFQSVSPEMPSGLKKPLPASTAPIPPLPTDKKPAGPTR